MNKILQIIDLKKNFGAITASNNINFCLETGEIHALIGPNGAGKSTLIKQIMGEMKQDSGEIILSGINISNLTTEDRIHLGFARSFQITDVISDFTIFQNVLLAKIGKEKKFYNFYSKVAFCNLQHCPDQFRAEGCEALSLLYINRNNYHADEGKRSCKKQLVHQNHF